MAESSNSEEKDDVAIDIAFFAKFATNQKPFEDLLNLVKSRYRRNDRGSDAAARSR